MPLPPPDDLSGPNPSGIPTGWKATGPNPTPPARQLLDAAASSFASQLQPNDLRTVTGQGSCDSTLAVAAQGPCEVPTTEELTAAIPIYSTKLLDSYGLPVPGSPQPGTLSALTQVGNQNGVLSHVVQDSCTVPRQPFLSGLDIPDGSGLTEDTYGLYDVIDPATGLTIPAPGKPDPTVQRKQLKVNADGETIYVGQDKKLHGRQIVRVPPDLLAGPGIEFGGTSAPTDPISLVLASGGGLTASSFYQYVAVLTTSDPTYTVSPPGPVATITTDATHLSVTVTLPAIDATIHPNATGYQLFRLCQVDQAMHLLTATTGGIGVTTTLTDSTSDATLASAVQMPTSFPLEIETDLATFVISGTAYNQSGLVDQAGDDLNGLSLLLATDAAGVNISALTLLGTEDAMHPTGGLNGVQVLIDGTTITRDSMGRLQSSGGGGGSCPEYLNCAPPVPVSGAVYHGTLNLGTWATSTNTTNLLHVANANNIGPVWQFFGIDDAYEGQIIAASTQDQNLSNTAGGGSTDRYLFQFTTYSTDSQMTPGGIGNPTNHGLLCQFNLHGPINVDGTASFGQEVKPTVQSGTFATGIAVLGSGVASQFEGDVEIGGNLTFIGSGSIVGTSLASTSLSGTTTIGGSPSDSLGFFGATPVTQQTGGAATAAATYGSNEQGMLNRLYAAARAYGLLS